MNGVIEQDNVIAEDVARFLDALNIEEKIQNTITMNIGGSGDYLGDLDYRYEDQQKIEPPQVLAFLIGGDEPTEFVQQLPAFGFYSYDAGYGGYPIADFTGYNTFKDYTNVASRSAFFLGGNPIAVIYIIQDKEFKQRIPETV